MKRLVGLFGVVLLLLLAACSGNQGSTSENEEKPNPNDQLESTGEPIEGGKLTIVDLNDAQGLDPHSETNAQSMHYIENMYNTLFKYKEGTYGEIEGDLVEEYEISEDGKVYTFTLHEGVKFHNGDDLTSKDVKYSIERIVEQLVRAPQFEDVESIETPDDKTVIVNLKKPVAPFLTFLAYPMNAIVNQTVVEENGGKLDNADAGSGPFQLVHWKKDQEMVLDKFTDYFKEGLPYLDQVTWKAVPDETSRTTAIRNKEIDIILQLSPKDIQLLSKSEDLTVEPVTGTYWEYIGLNVTAGPLKEKAVRQAIATAIDREAMNKSVKFGQATILTGGPIPEGHWADAKLDTYSKSDIEKAKSLLKEAGYEDGFNITLKVGQNKAQVDAAQVVKQQLQPIGIDVEILQQEDSIFFDALGKKDFEMSIVGWVGFVDPDEFLYNIFHTEEVWNQQGYSNPEVDRLLEEGRETADQDERFEIYKKAQSIIVDEAPMVFLYANQHASAIQKGVHGFDVNPTVSTKSLENTWIDR
ncbi:ABC transporter substrate-binding protein [Sporosarcina obsidiansis]|uniref:ABC transporter substrate-binding protein n=1 Tax=Sporosarcina obsidiansis TaxID=2660748 RepID=UPI00129A5751|nr:ABC transporter substrate-binding protein [Sporosarcina obsidiansis]